MWDIAISMFIVILGICDVGNNNINGLWEWDQAHKSNSQIRMHYFSATHGFYHGTWPKTKTKIV
jgi:hypothetical protein